MPETPPWEVPGEPRSLADAPSACRHGVPSTACVGLFVVEGAPITAASPDPTRALPPSPFAFYSGGGRAWWGSAQMLEPTRVLDSIRPPPPPLFCAFIPAGGFARGHAGDPRPVGLSLLKQEALGIPAPSGASASRAAPARRDLGPRGPALAAGPAPGQSRGHGPGLVPDGPGGRAAPRGWASCPRRHSAPLRARAPAPRIPQRRPRPGCGSSRVRPLRQARGRAGSLPPSRPRSTWGRGGVNRSAVYKRPGTHRFVLITVKQRDLRASSSKLFAGDRIIPISPFPGEERKKKKVLKLLCLLPKHSSPIPRYLPSSYWDVEGLNVLPRPTAGQFPGENFRF